METVLIIIILFLVVVIGYLIIQTKKPAESTDKQYLNDLSRRLDEMNKTLHEQGNKSTDAAGKQFETMSKIVGEVSEKMKAFEATNRTILDATGELKNLQNILLNPKHRGNFGEFQLESMLENVFSPKDWQRQYKFKNGEIVDAVLFIKDKILPIDSKFSLENYNRMTAEKDADKKAEYAKLVKNDLKGRIDEASKYIRPSEKTMDFAFMFVPSEALYYDMLIGGVGTGVSQKDLINYAFKEKKVIIVSPTTFVAYLQTVLQGLNALKIESQAKDIIRNVEKLNTHLIKYDEFMQKLGNNLSTTVNQYNSAGKEFKKIDKDIVKITGGSESFTEPLVLDRPRSDE